MVKLAIVTVCCMIVMPISACSSGKPQIVTSVDYYGEHYQTCLAKARDKTSFVHHTMHEQALGNELNTCMTEYGWIMDGALGEAGGP